jgi:hypothetical protein
MSRTIPTDKIGLPVRSRHISFALCEWLINQARTQAQLDIAIDTCARIGRTEIKVAPLPEPPTTEPTPACKRFYAALAASGRAADILKVARISTYFRQHYERAIAWAEGKKNRNPQDSAITQLT